MRVIVAKEHTVEKLEPRKAFCNALIEMAREDSRIVVLDADLMSAIGTKAFQAEFPDRAIDCGIQEANMIGVAAGLSATGLIPYAHSFGPFVTRRACDQIFMSCAYAKQNVKIIGSDPGISATLNGGTHMPFEDVGIMRGMPEVTVIEPADCTAIDALIRESARHYGVWYMRFPRKSAIKVYEEGTTFEVGKANLLRDGGDATIISCGLLLPEALKAADILAEQGISVRVLDMFTIKPLDREAVIKAARETGAIVTAENHSVNNGLGSAVAEVLAEHCPTPQERIGSQDLFGEVGPQSYLMERFGMTAEDMVKAVQKAVARKS